MAYDLAGIASVAVRGQSRGAVYLREEFAQFPQIHVQTATVTVLCGAFQPSAKSRALLCNRTIAVGDGWCEFASGHRGIRWRVRIENIEQGPVQVLFDGGRLAARVFFLKTLIPILREVLQQSDATIIKASSVADKGRGYALAGWSGAGKTAAALGLLAEDLQYLSDTFSVLDINGRLHPFPVLLHLFRRNITSDVARRLGVRKRLASAAKSAIYCLSGRRINLSVTVSLAELFGHGQTGGATKLHRLVLLTNRPKEPLRFENIGEEEAVLRLICTERFEAADFERIRLAYLHVNSGSPLVSHWLHLERLLRSALRDTQIMELSYPGFLPPDYQRFIPAP